MNLRDEFIKLCKSQGIKIEKVRYGGKVIYKVNGSILYITFSKNLADEKEEKYFLQISEKKLKRFFGKEKGFFILFICGSLDNTFVIPVDDFLEIVRDYRPASDGNWKINILGRREVIKIEEDYGIQLSKKEYCPISNYKNKFEIIKAREETIEKIISMIQSLQEGKLKGIIEKPKILPEVIHRVELGFKRRDEIKYERLIDLSKSGEGNQFEKAVLLCFKYLGFEIDEETSGKPGELDAVILHPIKIGIECRSAEKSVGVDIIDELKRHIRRYEERKNYEKSSFKGLVICEDTTKQFDEDSITEKVFSLKVSTFVRLIQLSATYPLSPHEFKDFFNEYGSIDKFVINFINKRETEIKLRKDIMDILIKKSRPLNYYEIRTFLESNGWKVEYIEEHIKSALIELSGPLINAIRVIDNKYEYIKPKSVEADSALITKLKGTLR